MPKIAKYFIPHKNSSLLYYSRAFLRSVVPDAPFRWRLKSKLTVIDRSNLDYLALRVNYYNKLTRRTPLNGHATPVGQLPFPERKRVYYFDTVEYLRYFRSDLKAHFLFGDITHVPDVPSITKSRPVPGDNRNSVLLKLEKMRHFMFVKYDKPHSTKKNGLVWRGTTAVAHRVRFFEKHFGNFFCDIGQTNSSGGRPEWIKPFMTIDQQLEYKFILSLEGNDVATNLKWIMSSNSVAVMPRPKFETWFMEGTLVPDYHYILIKDDYSDLNERLDYFTSHPDLAAQILTHAHAYIAQFMDKGREDLLSLLVLEKYFVQTGQLERISSLPYPHD